MLLHVAERDEHGRMALNFSLPPQEGGEGGRSSRFEHKRRSNGNDACILVREISKSSKRGARGLR